MTKPQPTLDTLHALSDLLVGDVVDAHIPALEGSHRLIEFISPLHGEQPSNVCNGRLNSMFKYVLDHNMNCIIKLLSGVHKTVTLHGMTVHTDGRISIQARWIRVDAADENDKIIYQTMQYGKDGVELGYAGWAVKGSQRVTREQLISNPNAGIGTYLKTSDIYAEACGTDRSENPEWFTQMCKDISKFGGYVKSVRKNQSTRTQTTEVKNVNGNANTPNQTTSLGSMKKADLIKECEARELITTGTKQKLIDRIKRFDGNQTTAPAPVEVDPRVAEMKALQAQLDALSAEMNGAPAPVAAAPVQTTAPVGAAQFALKQNGQPRSPTGTHKAFCNSSDLDYDAYKAFIRVHNGAKWWEAPITDADIAAYMATNPAN